MVSGEVMKKQLQRQKRWLSESRKWIFREYLEKEEPVKTALDVGCGPGFISKEFQDVFNVFSIGIDIDMGMLESAKALDMEILLADGGCLPFEDSSFDLVHCTFTMMWIKDPNQALAEMRRVSRKWVVCFAEPDYGARVDHPQELSGMGDFIADSIKRDGGDPYIGRKLREYFSIAQMNARIGVYDSVWSLEQLKAEFRDEWDFLKASMEGSEVDLDQMEQNAKEAVEKGTRLQFTPIFYAVARV